MGKTWLRRCSASLLVLTVAVSVCAQQRRTLATPPPPPGQDDDKLLKVTTWWPDPTTGLMWTGSNVALGPSFPQAVAACTDLVVDGRTGWRLPTIDELDGVLGLTSYKSHLGDLKFTDVIPTLKWLNDGKGTAGIMWLWSSTPAPTPGDYYSERLYQVTGHADSKPTDQVYHGAACVRTMEPDVLDAAKAAPVPGAVPNLATLQAAGPYGSLFKAHDAYKAGQYQEALNYSREFLAFQPDSPEAYLNVGISEGALGQWDQSIIDLNKAAELAKKLKNSKDYDPIMKYMLEWAKKSQSAAEKGKTLNPKTNILYPPLQ